MTFKEFETALALLGFNTTGDPFYNPDTYRAIFSKVIDVENGIKLTVYTTDHDKNIIYLYNNVDTLFCGYGSYIEALTELQKTIKEKKWLTNLKQYT